MSEYHIGSFIVRCFKHDIKKLKQELSLIGKVEVHQESTDGKVILTIEGSNHRQIADKSEQIRSLSSVVDLVSVYHEYITTNLEQGAQHDA